MGPPNLRLVLSEEAEGKLSPKCDQINDLGITVNSANILTALIKLGDVVLH